MMKSCCISTRISALTGCAALILALAGCSDDRAGGSDDSNNAEPENNATLDASNNTPDEDASPGDEDAPPDAPAAAQLAAGNAHTCAWPSMTPLCWGSDRFGQLGDGMQLDRGTPMGVLSLGAPTQAMALGLNHSCALSTTGGVLCWGFNEDRQIGDGSTDDRPEPTAPEGLSSGVTALAAGLNHTCALLEDGTVRCWGANGYGQLGDGERNARFTPFEVVELEQPVVALAAGSYHSCAILDTGALTCWGSNERSQIGRAGGLTATPVPITGLGTGVRAVTAGQFHTCVLLEDGTVQCLGDNDLGQLGLAQPGEHAEPQPVPGLSDVVAIAAGSNHTCALQGSGAVLCWGDNASGQLGQADLASTPTPSEVVGLGGAPVALVAGARHTCAQLDDGAVLCWGDNASGQLGDGGMEGRATPAPVTGLP